MSIAAPARDLKLATIELEHSHPLGRLWDIDVLTPKAKFSPAATIHCRLAAACCASKAQPSARVEKPIN